MNQNTDLSKIDQILINSAWVNWTRLPAIVAFAGITFSSILSCLLYTDFFTDHHLLNSLNTFLHWIVLIFGISFFVLMAFFIRSAQITRRQSVHLENINKQLLREMNNSLQIRESKQKLKHALLQGQKLQAMGTMAGGIAHDFNNLLYVIVGYTQMAREDIAQNTQLYTNLGHILEACQRGQELVERILTFSRRQHHQLDILRLKPTIEAALSLLKQTIPSSVIIHFDMPNDMQIDGNKTLMHQILVNLINNAVEAMDGEGTITIRVTHIEANDPVIQQLANHGTQGYCKMEISDTGHGMDKATMERIFEPFYTTKEVGKGTGLGLSIVHSIIKDHHGEITVTSKSGTGTTFTILLPEHQQL